MKYNLSVDIDELGETAEEVEKLIRIGVQRVLLANEFLVNSITVKKSEARPAGAPRAKGTAGRKPVNRPKVEAWIRKNITAGPSTQGTMGLHGVDKDGRSNMKAANRIYPHRLADPVNGVGLGMAAITKALGELEGMGYLERGFAAGAPFYELIRPLEEEGMVGVRGRAEDEPLITQVPGATPREIDFTNIGEDDGLIDDIIID